MKRAFQYLRTILRGLRMGKDAVNLERSFQTMR